MQNSGYTYLLVVILFAFSSMAMAQPQVEFLPEYKASFQTMISSGNDLPFWMTANQNGIYSKQGSSYQLAQFGFNRNIDQDTVMKWSYTYGANLVYGYAGSSAVQVNEYWIGVRFRSLLLKAGAMAEPILYNGLSSTNGNMYNSGNARPIPGLILSSNGYIPSFIAKKWLSVRFLYNEGFLNDSRVVTHAHLHHKNLYLKGTVTSSVSIEVGLEHYVFWGGNSPIYGKLPGEKDYFRYILGLAGGSDSDVKDQVNAAGNQLGSYNLQIQKDWTNISASFYWNHPFEDRSGMELANLPDGLWGIHVMSKKRNALVTDVLYEFMNTRNQSGSFHLIPAPTPENPDRLSGRGMDNYFNHWAYRSGFTHFQRMIGTPLFVPEINAEGVSTGFLSTRMWMHHLGVSGTIGSGFYWKSLLTWSRNFGNYGNVYPDPIDQFSFLEELRYEGKELPFKVKTGIAGDLGQRFEQRLGGYLGVEICF